MAEIYRDIYSKLDAWKDSTSRHPLLVRGARQVGKSHAIRTWARKNFENFLEINLEEQSSLRSVFQKDLTADQLLQNLELGTGVNLFGKNSALFIDEIQSEPRALLALRYLYEQKPELPVLAAGSLVEFVLEEVGLPVGRVDQLTMGPVSFREFLAAMGKDQFVRLIKESPLNAPVPDIAHNQLLDLLRTYFYVGGMPSAVTTYVETKSLNSVSEVHARILKGYEDDFQKYAKEADWAALEAVFASAPQVVGESRVKYVRLDREIRGEKIKTAVNLLAKAEVLEKVVSSYAKTLPLRAGAQAKFFKLIFLDIGLLHHAMGFDWRKVSLEDDLTDIKQGAFAEQFVGQELLTGSEINDASQLFYWYRSVKGSDAEVDYLVQYEGAPVPVEVKSGSRGTLKSLRLYIEEFGCKKAFVLSQRNIERMEETTFLPLYLASRLNS